MKESDTPLLTEDELALLDQHISNNADILIAKGYKQWRKERRQLRKSKKYVTQEDRLREIEEEMLEQG